MKRGPLIIVLSKSFQHIGVVHWPKSGMVNDYIINFEERLKPKLHSGDTYLVFDRYYKYNTKSVAKYASSAETSWMGQLEEGTTMPSQKVVLTTVYRTINLVVEHLSMLPQNYTTHFLLTSKHPHPCQSSKNASKPTFSCLPLKHINYSLVCHLPTPVCHCPGGMPSI